MPDAKAFWGAVRALEAKLQPVNYITSLPADEVLLPNWTGGRTIMAPADVAAQRYKRSHAPTRNRG